MAAALEDVALLVRRHDRDQLGVDRRAVQALVVVLDHDLPVGRDLVGGHVTDAQLGQAVLGQRQRVVHLVGEVLQQRAGLLAREVDEDEALPDVEVDRPERRRLRGRSRPSRSSAWSRASRRGRSPTRGRGSAGGCGPRRSPRRRSGTRGGGRRCRTRAARRPCRGRPGCSRRRSRRAARRRAWRPVRPGRRRSSCGRRPVPCRRRRSPRSGTPHLAASSGCWSSRWSSR